MINGIVLILSILLISCSSISDKHDYSLDTETKKEIVDSIISNTIDKYVSLDLALKIDKFLSNNIDNDIYKKIINPSIFADSITKHLKEITNDKHFKLIYYPDSIPDPKNKFQNNIKFYDSLNYGFRKLDIMDGNIGYLKIDGFLPAYEDTVYKLAINSMVQLGNCNAIIFDLTDNIGGDESLVKLYLSFLLDSVPIHYSNDYVRYLDETYEQWTLKEIPVKRFLSKSVYILTSNKTFSAGEYFAYNLQAFKRALIVGETTKGAANGCFDIVINDHFLLKLPFIKSINFITQTDWEGKGVEPDIKTLRNKALTTSYLLALKKIYGKVTDTKKIR
jgi:C-terminal processing protease CtpA/Prc